MKAHTKFEKEPVSFVAKVSKMGKRHKMINVPKRNPIVPGDLVKVKKI